MRSTPPEDSFGCTTGVSRGRAKWVEATVFWSWGRTVVSRSGRGMPAMRLWRVTSFAWTVLLVGPRRADRKKKNKAHLCLRETTINDAPPTPPPLLAGNTQGRFPTMYLLRECRPQAGCDVSIVLEDSIRAGKRAIKLAEQNAYLQDIPAFYNLIIKAWLWRMTLQPHEIAVIRCAGVLPRRGWELRGWRLHTSGPPWPYPYTVWSICWVSVFWNCTDFCWFGFCKMWVATFKSDSVLINWSYCFTLLKHLIILHVECSPYTLVDIGLLIIPYLCGIKTI